MNMRDDQKLGRCEKTDNLQRSAHVFGAFNPRQICFGQSVAALIVSWWCTALVSLAIYIVIEVYRERNLLERDRDREREAERERQTDKQTDRDREI